MEENKIMEKLWSEAQTVEVPPELSPERMRECIEGAQTSEKTKNKSMQKSMQRRFFRSGYTGRVAAAAVVFAASLGAFGVANNQAAAPMTQDTQRAQIVQDIHSESDMQVQAVKEVKNQDDGLADGSDLSDTELPAEEVVVKTLGDYRLASGYKEVGEMLSELMVMRGYNYTFATEGAEDVAAADGAMASGVAEKENMKQESAVSNLSDTSADKDSQQAGDYSTTNLQVTGVDESDIVKTDGHYIYIANSDRIQIVDASSETPRQLTSIKPPLSGNMDTICEMYVADGRLMLIVQKEKNTDLQNDAALVNNQKKEAAVCDDVAYIYNEEIATEILTYDITNPAGAKLTGTFCQDGAYNTSRKIGDRIYLFTDYGYPVMYDYMRIKGEFSDGDVTDEDKYLELETETKNDPDAQKAISTDEIKQKLPKIQGRTIPENCIYLPKDGCENGVVISAMDVKAPETVIDQKLIFSGYSTMYVTKESIILYRSDYSMASDRSCTKLTRFAIDNGRIVADCAEAVPGNIEDTFAIHETGDGYMYVLTTDYTQDGNTNQLYVLDKKLKIHGKIGHIADGERVYAARFVDDIGYFVTYRNMDPLFTVDFSDKANPTLIGELEIPGFSDYLQFWDDTHLIGVGDERKEKDSEFVGIKVSLYDISDPTNVKESSKIVMEDACYAPASYSYKALLADSKKNVIAFLTEDKGEDYQVSERIFTVKDGVLKKALSDHITEEESYYGITNYRNLYIGDRLYLVREGLVIVYDMADNFEKIATCSLK